MPELRNVKASDVIAAFIRAGGIHRKGKGDHVNIKMQNGMLITIPNKGNVKIGLLKTAIKKAGLTEEEFITFLGR